MTWSLILVELQLKQEHAVGAPTVDADDRTVMRALSVIAYRPVRFAAQFIDFGAEKYVDCASTLRCRTPTTYRCVIGR
jgi:hypothetical protein